MRAQLLILSIAILTAGTCAQTNANRENSRTRLRLQVLTTYPVPVIDSAHADAKDSGQTSPFRCLCGESRQAPEG